MPRTHGYHKLISVTPTLSTSEYVSDDRLGTVMKLSDALRHEAGRVELTSAYLIDKTASDAEIDVLFFNQDLTTLGADNDPFSISDAELVEKFTGAIRFGCSITTGTQRVYSYGEFNLTLQGAEQECSAGRDLFAVAIIRDTATFAADSLTFKFGVVQH